MCLKAPNGYRYAYYDPTVAKDGFQVLNKTLDTPDGAVGRTLLQVYKGSNTDVAYMMYNDEDPNEKKYSSNAHSKGVMGFDKEGGFWLLHSTPRYPAFKKDGYTGFPDIATKYGQSFICVEFKLDEFDKIASQMQINHPALYDHNLPDSLADKLPNMKAWVAGDHARGSVTSNITLESADGTEFTSFAKTEGWDSDLYEKMVSPLYGTDLAVESWQNGVGRLDSFCKGKDGEAWTVENILNIELADGTAWKETQDHSKWAVSLPESQNSLWAKGTQVGCIGDMNRQNGQRHRGGGTLCLEGADLWTALSDIVVAKEECNSTSARWRQQ